LNRRTLAFNSAVVLGLLLLLVLFFRPAILGHKTLLPLDNLFTDQPWKAFASRFGIGIPHNELLSDLILQNYTWKRLIVEALKSRQLPLWNPYILAGQPFLAAGQHSALYPLSLLFYILPLAQAYGYFAVLQLLLAGVFMYFYARTIGLERIGAVISAVAFALSGFMVVSVVHPMIIAAASWLPLVLGIVERLIRTQEQAGTPKPVSYIPWIAVGAAALGCQFLAGHIEIAYYVMLVTAFYAVCRLGVYWWRVRSWIQSGKLALAVGLLLVLGFGLAAVQMLPLYELATENFRQETATYSQIIGWAYPLRRLVAFLVPDFFGNPAHHSYLDVFSNQVVSQLRNAQGESIRFVYWDVKNYVEGGSYVGVLPLLLALVAVLKARTRYVWIFLSLGIVSLLFVFGTPLYAVLYYLLPGVNQLHSPFRWIFPYTFSVSVLAGCGASWLASSTPRAKSSWLRWLGGLAFGAGLLGLGTLLLSLRLPQIVLPLAQRAMLSLAGASEAFADGRAFFSYEFRNFLIFFAALAGAGLTLWLAAARARDKYPIWQLVALSVAIGELFIIGAGFNPAADPAILDFEPPVVAFMKQDKDLWRFTTFDRPEEKLFNANAGSFYRFSDVRGYDSMIPTQYVEYMKLIEPQYQLLYNRVSPLSRQSSLDSRLLDLLNVKYVLTTQVVDNAHYTLVYDGELRVYRNEDCLPRAFVVHSAQVIPEAAARHEALLEFDPGQVVILEEEPAVTWADATEEAWEPAQISSYGLNEVIVEVELTHGGYLVLTDNWFSGWKAYDTQPGEKEQDITLYRANGTFRAVALGPGQHLVRFKYTPLSFKLGLFATFMAAVVLVLLLSYWLWRRLYRGAEEGEPEVKRVAKNALTPMVLSLVNRIIDMAFAMLTLRILAPEGAGRMQFAINFIGYFETLVFFGLGALLTREMSKHRDEARRYVTNSVLLRLIIWLGAVPALALATYAYMRFSGLTPDTIWAIVFFFVALIPSLVSDSLTAVFYAHEKMEYPAAITSVTTVLRVTLGTLALLLGYGFVGLAATTLVVNLATVSILSVLVARLFSRSWGQKVGFEGPFTLGMARDSLPLMVNNLLSKVFFQVDVLLLKPLRGDVEVGYYGAAYRYIRGLDIIPSYFTMAVFPLISRFAESKRDSLIRAYILSVKLLTMVALPIAVGTTFVARDLILILAGADYLPQSMLALQILVWYVVVGFINSVTHYVLIAIQRQRFLTKAFVVGAAFNIVVNLLLIPRFGYLAAAATTVLSEVALFIPFYYCVRKDLTALPWLDIFWRPGAAAALMAMAMWLLRHTTALLSIPVGGVVYLVALVALGTLRQPDVILVMELLPARVRQRFPILSSRS